jgi:thiol-disulfide isomerase/thioredoxin
MKIIKKIVFLLAIVSLLIPLKSNAAENEVNMYIFYRDGCPHCAALEVALEDIKEEYTNLKIHRYEVGSSFENSTLMARASNLLDANATGVPFAIIGTKTFVGYSESITKGQIEYALELYSKVTSYSDPVGEMLGVVSNSGTLTYEEIAAKNEKKYNYTIDVPFTGPTETKDLSLPVISIILGTLDGFNPCAMWVLLFLISMLISMKDKKRMWILGSTFLITSAIIYLFFMLAWLNIAIFVGAIWWVKLLIALVALAGGYFNLRAYVRAKEDGCEIVDEKKRKKIFTKIKKFTSEKSFPLALAGIITLAISVNFIELTCSAGLPVVFANILALNNLSTLEYSFYIFLYILFFLLDDLIVFFIAMTTLKLTGISNKYGKYSHLIGGILMVIIGILMIVKPEWLMFNF